MMATLASATSPANAQVPPPPPKPVDQAVEDVGQLSASLRETQLDLRQTNGFQQVYRVPGQPDLLMRSSGGVHAVFPQSAYTRGKNGLTPLIPAGTVFYIGLPTQWPEQLPVAAQSAAKPEQPTRIKSRLGLQLSTTVSDDALEQAAGSAAIDTEVADVLHAPSVALATLPLAGRTVRQSSIAHAPSDRELGPTLANNSEYRARRIDLLLQRAAEAHMSAGQKR